MGAEWLSGGMTQRLSARMSIELNENGTINSIQISFG